MRVRKLTPSGDYSFGHGSADFYVNDPLGVGQKVQTRLRLFEGEWFLDKNDGTPWYEQVFGIRSNPTYDLVVKSRISTTTGVQRILSYSSVLSANIQEAGLPPRRLSITAQVLTVFSTQPVTVETNI